MIALLGSITLIAVVVRLTERLAVSPWEPAIAMEAARLNAGLPLYEAGHATHMYGPLLTVLLAEIFRVTGLNLLAGRRELSSNGRMHLVIIVKHGWRAQVLHGANRDISKDVGHRKPSQSEPDLEHRAEDA